MKKWALIGAFLLSVFGISSAYSCGGYNTYNQGYGYRGNYRGYNQGYYQGNYQGNYSQEYQDFYKNCPADSSTGYCWCQYVRYEPCPYMTQHCVEEQYTCPKTCCRMVPQYYEVQRCRYIPEYYTETYCRQVPEYYQVDECKTRKKIVCEPKCDYVPKYYWKCECNPSSCK